MKTDGVTNSLNRAIVWLYLKLHEKCVVKSAIDKQTKILFLESNLPVSELLA